MFLQINYNDDTGLNKYPNPEEYVFIFKIKEYLQTITKFQKKRERER